MTDASNNGKKPQKGALGGSPFGHSDRASEPYADIDVPDYEGATPEPATKDAPKAPGAPKAPAAPAAKATKSGAAPADKKPAAKVAPTAKAAAKPKAKSGDAKAPATAQAKPEKGDAPKKTAAKATGTKPAEADAKAPAKGKDAAERTDTAGVAERGTAEQSRPRDIYALAGRARPQRIEAPAPEPAPEAESAPAADVPKTDGEQPGAAEDQRTEVLDLSGADAGTGSQGTGSQGTLAQQQTQPQTGTNTAALGAGAAGAGAAGAASGYAAGGGTPKNDADTGAQGYPAQPGDAHPQGTFDADAQWDPNAQPVGPEGEVAYGPDGQPLAPVAEPVETRRGTQSLGLAILRIVAGAVLLISGLQTLFGFAGDPGISALESRLSFFSGSGVLAVAIPAAEVIAGGLLILGLLTPFAAALAFVVSAFMATFHLSGHQGSLWPYGLNPVIHQWALYALISLSLIFTGPGGASLDRSRSWATRPLASSWIFAVLGIAGFAALWLLTGGRNPF
ncbi:DoxX family protein [Corynebacterium sp. MSK039]|uniref:DoxX family protein n=1 Tax=Corynebacterium sp. MSK039 TaxID=3050193 RepID=UPI00254C1AC1|nr:DoxX family protein [Corynebacterium sp. MSK039]MDK8790737.1 DoxX family protein [Corynebacterium sp. MSK039]